jgi:hypothetical protein
MRGFADYPRTRSVDGPSLSLSADDNSAGGLWRSMQLGDRCRPALRWTHPRRCVGEAADTPSRYRTARGPKPGSRVRGFADWTPDHGAAGLSRAAPDASTHVGIAGRAGRISAVAASLRRYAAKRPEPATPRIDGGGGTAAARLPASSHRRGARTPAGARPGSGVGDALGSANRPCERRCGPWPIPTGGRPLMSSSGPKRPDRS